MRPLFSCWLAIHVGLGFISIYGTACSSGSRAPCCSAQALHHSSRNPAGGDKQVWQVPAEGRRFPHTGRAKKNLGATTAASQVFVCSKFIDSKQHPLNNAGVAMVSPISLPASALTLNQAGECADCTAWRFPSPIRGAHASRTTGRSVLHCRHASLPLFTLITL